MNFGDCVSYHIDGGLPGEGIVIGTMRYSDDVLLLAADDVIGMPIHRGWCRRVSVNCAKAKQFRERYEDAYPDRLREIAIRDLPWHDLAR